MARDKQKGLNAVGMANYHREQAEKVFALKRLGDHRYKEAVLHALLSISYELRAGD